MNIVIIGATSYIAMAVARLYSDRGMQFFLVARNKSKLDAVAQDLSARSKHDSHTYAMDANEFDHHQACLDAAKAALGQIDLVLLAHGTLSDQKACELSIELALQEMSTNALSFVSLLTLFANDLEAQGSGTLAVISSVAGDRGRQSNYVYGAAKSMVSTFCQGLRNRLSKKGVNVLTIKPGFVSSPMTAHLNGSGLLWATPEQIAKPIVKAIDKRKSVIYVPWFWWGILTIIKLVPERVFKKLSL